MQAGDLLLVWRLDRLGRSMVHLVTLVEELQDRGIGFRSICDGAIDTTTASGELVFNVFSALAQFERGDTSRACGDTPNGFLAIFNWALLDDGEHDAVAYDNGVEFDRSTFTVGTLGEPFVQDASAEVRVEDFPSPGETTLLVWNESTQHFEIVDGARANMRSMTDRPDDISGAQIHPMYVLPSDGADAHLDTDETIATSVAAIQHWLSSNVSQRLRLDTFQGSLDITFFRLALTDAQMAAMGLFVRDQIERELSQAGRLSSDKLYAVYYGGKSTVACGGAAWPPALPGVVAAMYLNGEPPGARPCHTNPLGMSLTTMGYWEFSMLHELFHLLGAVSTGAPNHVLRGHVADDPTELNVRRVPTLETASHRCWAERLLRS